MLKTGIAGFGWWGKHITKRLRDSRSIQIEVIAEPQVSLREEIADYGIQSVVTFDELLLRDDINAIILATPHMYHEEQVVAAANAGKHVFCEKPLGLTAQSAQRSVDACSQAGVVLGIGHERRFEPALVRLHKMIQADELGTIMHVEAAFSHDKLAGIEADGWRTSKIMSPGAGMTGMGIHLTDLFIWMFGKINSVQAHTRRRVLDWETGDMVVAQFAFDAGMTGSMSAILATPHFMRFQVFGSQKWVEVRNDTHSDTPGGVTHFTTAESERPSETEEIEWSDSVVENLQAFAAAIDGSAAYPFSDEQLIHNIEVYEAIVSSADSGQTAVPGEL